MPARCFLPEGLLFVGLSPGFWCMGSAKSMRASPAALGHDLKQGGAFNSQGNTLCFRNRLYFRNRAVKSLPGGCEEAEPSSKELVWRRALRG